MADVPPDPDSGAAGTVLRTARALRELGHEVDEVWCDGLGRRIAHGNLHYLLELPRAYRRALRRRLVNRSYDVVEVSQPHGHLAARAFCGERKGSVFIHRSHGFELRLSCEMKRWIRAYGGEARPVVRRLLSRALAQLLERRAWMIAKYADGHIVSATACAEFLARSMGVPLERIAVVAQGVADSYLIDPPGMSVERARRVLHVGQFAFFKAPMMVAETMRRLAAHRSDLEFTWVSQEQYHAEIRRLAGPELTQRMRILPWMSEDELIRLYDQHGLFLFPSFFEGFGKVFLEAMARGLCVVASDSGGARDVIRNRVDGLIVPTGDIDTMEQACRRVLEEAIEARAISAAAVKAARRYTWRRSAEACVDFYRQRLSARATNRPFSV